jgi:hypothetical protein
LLDQQRNAAGARSGFDLLSRKVPVRAGVRPSKGGTPPFGSVFFLPPGHVSNSGAFEG